MQTEPASNVVTIYGDDCDPRVSVAAVVTALEQMLERARAGEIIGIAIAALHFDKSTGHICAGQSTHLALIGGLVKLTNELAR
jgi:hypothetical protein